MAIKNSKIIELTKELRRFIIEHVAQNGGHLGATLGVIELTVALHEAFTFLGTESSDKLVWDVGHQAYAHKILTERKENFHTIRKLNGLSKKANLMILEQDILLLLFLLFWEWLSLLNFQKMNL